MKQKNKTVIHTHEWIYIAILCCVVLTSRIFLYHTVFWRTPDSVEYINVARNINEGKGLTQSIKWHFYDDSPVVTTALNGRPILTPILISFILRFTSDLHYLQIFQFIVSLINVLLFFFVAKNFLKIHIAFLASLLVALNPNIFISDRLILSEPIFASFVLASFLVFFTLKDNWKKYLILGILVALGYLTRVEGMLLFTTFIVFLLKKPKFLFQFCLTFLIIISPVLYLNFLYHKNPFFTYNSYHFQVKHFSIGMGQYGVTFPKPLDFLMNNIIMILSQIRINFLEHIHSLLSFSSLGLFSIPLIVSVRKNYKVFLPFLILITLLLIPYTFTWSAIFERARHFNVIYMLSVLIAFKVIEKEFKNVLVISFITGMFIAYIVFDVHRVVWAKTVDSKLDVWTPEKKEKIYDYLKHTHQNDVIASTDPWLVNLFSKHPTVMLPGNISKNEIYNKYVKQFSVCYLLSDSFDFSNVGAKEVYKADSMKIFSTGICKK